MIARDNGQSPLSSQSRVTVYVRDVNDNAPIIELDSPTDDNRVSIQENSDVGDFVAYIRVSDPDSASNGDFRCDMSDVNFRFEQLHENDFKIVTSATLDRERRAQYVVQVTCVDFGAQPMTSSLSVIVDVTDANDHAPVFAQALYLHSMEETNDVGQVLFRVNASDDDEEENARVTYSFAPSNDPHFSSLYIDPTSGNVTVTGPINYELEHEINMQVLARDAGEPALTSSASIRIEILDIDDERPEFIFNDAQTDSYELYVDENRDPDQFVDVIVAQDADSDQFNSIQFSLRPEADANPDLQEIPFRIDPDSGELFTTMRLDREERDAFQFRAVASGGQPNNWVSDVSVTVHVRDANDNPPQFDFPNSNNNSVQVPASLPVDYVIARIMARDADAGAHAQLTYELQYAADDSRIAFDVEADGTIVTSRAFDTNVDVIVLTVVVRDGSDVDSHEVSTFLNVVFAQAQLAKSKRGNSNETLVIIIAVLAAAIVTVLTLAIVCLLRHHNKHKRNDYLHGVADVMNAHTIVSDDVSSGPPSANMVHPGSKSTLLLDSSFNPDSKAPLDGAHDNAGMTFDSDKGSYVVLPWKALPGSRLQSMVSKSIVRF